MAQADHPVFLGKRGGQLGIRHVKNMNLRLCVVSPVFHPNVGGPGRQVYSMISELTHRDIEVAVIARRLNLDTPKMENLKVYSVTTPFSSRHILSKFAFWNFVISFCFSFGALLKLIMIRNSYDIVQFYGASLPLLICAPVLKLLRKPVIAKLSGAQRGMEAGQLRDTPHGPLLVRMFSPVHKFIAMSSELSEKLLADGFPATKIIKIPNGVDTERFRNITPYGKESLKKLLGLSGRKVIVYSGRLVAGKGLDVLLRAMPQIMDKERSAYLLLLGDGPLKKLLKQEAEVQGISAAVQFEGIVDNVLTYLNAADLFVLPSFSEGMPNALLEAMACGLPVVATRIGGITDIINDEEEGILVLPGSNEALGNAILKILRDEQYGARLGIAARNRAVQQYDIKAVADQYLSLYNSLCQ